MNPTIPPPGTESWAERYGAIGVVAALALAALIIGLRQFLVERREDRTSQAKGQEAHDRQIAELHAQMVKAVRDGHQETLKLLADQQDKHDKRYQELLERHITQSRQQADALQGQSQAMLEAFKGLVRKIRGGTE